MKALQFHIYQCPYSYLSCQSHEIFPLKTVLVAHLVYVIEGYGSDEEREEPDTRSDDGARGQAIQGYGQNNRRSGYTGLRTEQQGVRPSRATEIKI
jgi:hypothetical protein